MTRRLYYEDAYIRVFESRVVDRCRVNGRSAVILSETAFYPTGGGQPHDVGVLNGTDVLDVYVLGNGEIAHVLSEPLSNDLVQGEVDWERRFDHMQQHTGQHILSQAFVRTCGAETVAFHLGQSASTIDLDQAPLDIDVLMEAEAVANQVVFEARDVVAHFVRDDELLALPLRKTLSVDGPTRIVQVDGFDWSACGGTHLRTSAEVGPIKIVRVERRKEVTRVHFLCGWRAVRDYALKHEIVQSLAAHLTTSESEIIASVSRLEDDVKELGRALAAAQNELIDYKVPTWLSNAKKVGDVAVVRLTFDLESASILREMAHRFTAEPGIVALLATLHPHPQFVFARSEDVEIDISQVMRMACEAVDGRGGGRPSFAQGGAPSGAPVDLALDKAVAQLIR